MHRLSALLGAVVTALAFTQAGSAADLPSKTPLLQPTPVANWTGFYLGVSAGARWSNADWTTTVTPIVGSVIPPTASFDSTTGRVGGFLGYNWQFAPSWVVGIEGDF